MLFRSLGLAFVPDDLVAPHVAQGNLVRVTEDWCPAFPGLHLYYPSRRQSSRALQLVVEALRYRRPALGEAPRTVIALFLGAFLGAVTAAYRTDSESMRKSMAEARQDFERRVTEVQNERNSTVESLKTDSANLQTQLDQAQKRLSQFDVGLQNPALLVDAHVIEVNGGDGQIFIDIGKQQRLQAGTTFEVFETPDQIRSAGDEGPRGKASIQVMRVTTSPAPRA